MAYVHSIPPTPCHCGKPATVVVVNCRQTMSGFFCDDCKTAELRWLAIEEEVLQKFCGEMVAHGAPLPEVARRAIESHPGGPLASFLRGT